MKRTAITRRPSRARRQFDAEYAHALVAVIARGCEFTRYALPCEMVGPTLSEIQCDGRLVGHHAKGRRASDANDLANLRCLCDKHHQYVHAHGRWAREVGLMLSRIA